MIRSVFRRLDPVMWRDCGYNPVLMLGRVSQATLQKASTDPRYLALYRSACAMYDARVRKSPAPADGKLIAYFSAEYGLTECLPVYSCGLGILSGDHLKSSSDQDYPLTWEIQASQADYRGMAAIDPVFVKQKTSVPHTWHAAEVFLYLLDEPDSSSPAATKDGASAGSMFTNPVAARGADPWVVLWKNNYYFCQSGGPSVWVSRSSHLQDIGQGQRQRVWIPPPGTAYSKELWAPELHHLRGKWWIYVAADDGDNAHHRIVSVNLPGPAAMCSIRSHG